MERSSSRVLVKKRSCARDREAPNGFQALRATASRSSPTPSVGGNSARAEAVTIPPADAKLKSAENTVFLPMPEWNGECKHRFNGNSGR